MALYWVLRPFSYVQSRSHQLVLVEPNRYFDTTAADIDEKLHPFPVSPIAVAAVDSEAYAVLTAARRPHIGSQIFGDPHYVYVGPETPTHP